MLRVGYHPTAQQRSHRRWLGDYRVYHIQLKLIMTPEQITFASADHSVASFQLSLVSFVQYLLLRHICTHILGLRTVTL